MPREKETAKLYANKKTGSVLAAAETEEGDMHYRRLELPGDSFVVSKEEFSRVLKAGNYTASGSAGEEVVTDAAAAAGAQISAATAKEETTKTRSSSRR